MNKLLNLNLLVLSGLGCFAVQSLQGQTLYRQVFDYQFSASKPSTPVWVENDPPPFPVGGAVSKAVTSSSEAFWFFYNRYGQHSWDGLGGDVDVFIQFQPSSGLPYSWWDPTDNSIVLGAGFDSAYDVLTREFAVGVAYSEGLTGSGSQTASVRKSFGDAMAAMKDYDYSRNVWVVGENHPGYERYLNDPYLHGGADWIWDINGDVSHDSSVASLAFYLMAEGGTHPRGKSSIDVTPMGIENAASMLYEALWAQYTSSEDFFGAAVAQVDTAYQKFGYIAQASAASAWHAVGMSSVFWQPNMTVPDTLITYMGWVDHEGDSVHFRLHSDNERYYYTNYDSDTGAMDIRSENTYDWFWTSGEMFPWYWSYTNTTWRVFNGTFQP